MFSISSTKFNETIKEVKMLPDNILLKLTRQYNIPFINKEQAINVVSYMLLNSSIKTGNMDNDIDDDNDNDNFVSAYNSDTEEKDDYFAPEKFITDLKNYLRSENYQESFLTLLKENGAIIAGGSVLSTYGSDKHSINDLDIYVNVSNAKNLIQYFLVNDFQVSNINLTPAYDQSFFKKNNIISRFSLYKNVPGNKYNRSTLEYKMHDSNRWIDIDIMIIPDNVKCSTVASNFDLSFCEIWFDGEKIHTKNSTTKEHVKNKSGILNKEYTNALLSCFNKFIINRINKYTTNYGYKIAINSNSDIQVGNDSTCVKPQISNDEDWVVRFLYNDILKRMTKFIYVHPIQKSLISFIDLQLKYPLTVFTLDNFKTIISKIEADFNIEDITYYCIKVSGIMTNTIYYNKILTVLNIDNLLIYNYNHKINKLYNNRYNYIATDWINSIELEKSARNEIEQRKKTQERMKKMNEQRLLMLSKMSEEKESDEEKLSDEELIEKASLIKQIRECCSNGEIGDKDFFTQESWENMDLQVLRLIIIKDKQCFNLDSLAQFINSKLNGGLSGYGLYNELRWPTTRKRITVSDYKKILQCYENKDTSEMCNLNLNLKNSCSGIILPENEIQYTGEELMVKIRQQNLYIVADILESNTSLVYYKNADGLGPLELAIQMFNFEIIKLLVEIEPNIVKDTNLFRQVCDIRLIDDDGYDDYRYVIQILDIFIQNGYKLTFEDLIYTINNKRIFEYLIHIRLPNETDVDFNERNGRIQYYLQFQHVQPEQLIVDENAVIGDFIDENDEMDAFIDENDEIGENVISPINSFPVTPNNVARRLNFDNVE